jgi:transitional endoplasmic reticulum ATPase
MSKFYGESEARLRNVFQDAEKNAPAIIFIDELDAIAPKREEVTGEVERRVVAQLLSLMDGLKTRGKVIVIGATNRPHALDPALRRPGRFDREIVIGVPDRDGRKEILQIHTRGMPLAKDVDLEELANRTHGFVGADLEALCKEAAMSALRRILPEIKLEEKMLPPEVLEKLQVTKEDFDNALKMVEPSAMREVLVEVPNVHWDDIGGLEDVKRELREAVEWPLKYPDAFKRMGIEPPRGILLYGPPGTGKTLLARAVATESEANFIAVKGPEMLSKWVGESERAVRETFRKARMAAPAIIFFDEIDAVVPRRGSGIGDAHVTERVISQLLTELDGLEKLENVVVIAATNRPDLIDSALLRPGRFDRLVLVPAPDKKARLEIFKIHTKGMPLAKDVDLETLAAETEGYAGSDIAALCREAAMLVLRKDIKSKEVQMKHFRDAMQKVRPTITKEIADSYKTFGQRYGKRLAEEVTRMHY